MAVLSGNQPERTLEWPVEVESDSVFLRFHFIRCGGGCWSVCLREIVLLRSLGWFSTSSCPRLP